MRRKWNRSIKGWQQTNVRFFFLFSCVCIYIYIYYVYCQRLGFVDSFRRCCCYCCCCYCCCCCCWASFRSLLFFLFCLYRRGNIGVSKVILRSFLRSSFYPLHSDSFIEGARFSNQSDGTVGQKSLKAFRERSWTSTTRRSMRVYVCYVCICLCVYGAALLGAFRLSNNYRCTIYIYIHIYM